MANSVLNYIINVVKKGDGDKQTLSSLGTLKSVMTGIGVAAGVATTAYVVLDRTLGEASRKTMKYAEDVRKLSSITNQGAEETSKLIQTMDDFKISADQLTVASKKLASQGLSPTVETMAQLSDEYLNINDGAKRAEFLTKNFGKAGLEMAEAMQAGGDAIRKQGEGVNKSLILTEKQVRAARTLEIAQDNLNDTWDALAVTVGNKVVPAQSEFLTGLNNILSATDKENFHLMRKINLLHQMPIDSAARSYMAMAEAIEETARATEKAAAEQANYSDLLKEWSMGEKDAARAMKEMGYAALETQLAIDGTIDGDDYQKLLDYRLAMGLITKEEYNAALEAKKLKDKLDKLDGKSIDVAVNFSIYGAPDFEGLAGSTVYNPGASNKNKPKKKPAKTGGDMGGAIGDAIGGWVNPAGWTVVGEHGKELIDPGGYVHSNAESRRLVAMGIAPMRGLAVGGDTEGGVFNPIGAGSLASVIASGTVINTSGRAGSSTSVQSPTAAIVSTAQAAQASAQASQQMANASAQSAAIEAASSKAMIDELRALRKDILAGFKDSVQQIVTV